MANFFVNTLHAVEHYFAGLGAAWAHTWNGQVSPLTAAHMAAVAAVLPLFAAIFIGLFGAKDLRNSSHVPAVASMFASFLIALLLLRWMDINAFYGQILSFNLLHWFHVGGFDITWGVYVDRLSVLYLCFVTGIGLLIFIYASAYMAGDFGYFRFFSYMSLFVFFMATLVLASNFVQLYLGWEGVGLASYLLIGYYYPRPAAREAAKKAFIVNRIGDFGFGLGIFLIYRVFHTVGFQRVLDLKLLTPGFVAAHSTALYWIPFLLLLGAIGKSAQFPLHVWLPDAMEGPTPVSALIHAATMVTAGIYLIARCMPLFAVNPAAMHTVAIIGCFTAFLAASIALCQVDLKRIWAYSTISQLGYMFMALGVAAGSAAVFHVVTHAFFKALLFLAAGSVMHAMGGELDIRRMSGLRRVMPITTVCMLVGCLALSGFPGFSGFFSKDAILQATMNSSWPFAHVLGIVGIIVAFMTAYYAFRAFFRVFMGPLVLPETAGHHEPSPFDLSAAQTESAGHAGSLAGATAGTGFAGGAVAFSNNGGNPALHQRMGHAEASSPGQAQQQAHGRGPNDGSPSMWIPLVILAIGAIGIGYIGVFGGRAHVDLGWIGAYLAPVLGGYHAMAHPHTLATGYSSPTLAAHHAGLSSAVMMTIGGIVAILGILLAAYFHWLNRHAATIVGNFARPVVRFLENKWYIDTIYHYGIVRPLWVLAHIFSIIDRFVIDGMVFVVGYVPQLGGYFAKPMQSGRLRYYGIGMVAGVAAVVLGVLYLLR